MYNVFNIYVDKSVQPIYTNGMNGIKCCPSFQFDKWHYENKMLLITYTFACNDAVDITVFLNVIQIV
jgi:hypothetical protein